MSKYENENLTEAANQIETSTIFDVFPLCRRYFPSDGTMLDTLFDLNSRHEEKTLTWQALADAWRKAIPENKQTSEEKTLQTIFDDRAEKESVAKNIIFEDGTAPLRSKQTMKLYYLLENKKFPNLLAYLRKHYAIDRERFFEKSEEFRVAPELQSTHGEDLIEAPGTFANQCSSNGFKKTGGSLWARLFSKTTTWEYLLIHVTLLKPLENTIYDTDQLYDVLMALQITKQVKPAHEPASRITTCKHCWRPALVRTTKYKHEECCPVHSYKQQDGKPSRKQAYQRALRVGSELRQSPHAFSRLSAKLMRFFPVAESNLPRIKLGLWDWWTVEPPENVSQLHVDQDTKKRLWTKLWAVRRLLLPKDESDPEAFLNNLDGVVEALMPLPEGADEKAIECYNKWLDVWKKDIRYFIPILARAEIWLIVFAKLNPKLKLKPDV